MAKTRRLTLKKKGKRKEKPAYAMSAADFDAVMRGAMQASHPVVSQRTHGKTKARRQKSKK